MILFERFLILFLKNFLHNSEKQSSRNYSIVILLESYISLVLMDRNDI